MPADPCDGCKNAPCVTPPPATTAAEAPRPKKNPTAEFVRDEVAFEFRNLRQGCHILRENGRPDLADVLERVVTDALLAVEIDEGGPLTRRQLYEAMLRLAGHAQWVSDLAKRAREPVQIGVLDFCRDQIERQVALLVAQDQGVLTTH